MTIPSPGFDKTYSAGQRYRARSAQNLNRAAHQVSPNSVVAPGVNARFTPSPADSVELDFEIFGLHDVQPNALIYQKGESWTKEGVAGGSPYRVPQTIATVQTNASGQKTRIVRVVPVKPQEKILLVCDQELYDTIPATPGEPGLKPTRSPKSQSKIADATLAKWDGDKLVAATGDDYDFTIFQISKSTPPAAAGIQASPIFYAEAVFRGGVGNGIGGTVQVITRIVCDELEGCRIIEPIIGNFFLVDLPITLVEKDTKGHYTQFVTSSFSPLPVNTDAFGHTITDLFSTSSIHYRRTVFSNMGTIATHSLSEYEPIRPTYVGGEQFIDTVFSWQPPDWQSSDNKDVPTIDIEKKHVRGECRYWQEPDQDGNTTPASPRHPLYLLRREPAITDSMVAIRQSPTTRDAGYQWRYINGKHFGKGTPFDNSKADDFNALYFTPTTITAPLLDPANSNEAPIGNPCALDTKPFCIGTVPSFVTEVVFDGKVDILPFLTNHSNHWHTDLSEWIDTVYHHPSGNSTFAVQGFSFIENSQLAMRTVRDNITSQPFGSYGESFMYQQQRQLDGLIDHILNGYTDYALGATATEFGVGFPLMPTATVVSVNALPDPITISEGTIYRVRTNTGGVRFFRVIANAWIEANTTPVFIVPTASQFVSAFTANWNSAFNAHFAEDVISAYQMVLSNLFTRFNELYPSVLHGKIVEVLPIFVRTFNSTFTTTPVNDTTFFAEFKNTMLHSIATDQAFSDAILLAYPDSDYPNTGQYASIDAWRQAKTQAAKAFIVSWVDKFKTAIENDLATLQKEATDFAHALVPPISTTIPFSASIYSPNITPPADPVTQLQIAFDPVDYHNYTRSRVIDLYQTQKNTPLKTQCRHNVLEDFDAELSKFHDNTAQAAWLFQTSATTAELFYPDIAALSEDTLSQTFSENTTNAVVNNLLSTGQTSNLHKELAAALHDIDIATEFQDWISYVFGDGVDYSGGNPATNPAECNATIKLSLASVITDSLLAATSAMENDPTTGTPNTSPLQTIIDRFYTSLYGSIHPIIPTVIQAVCVETGIPLSVNYQVDSFDLLPDPAMETWDMTARVGSVGDYSFYRVAGNGLASPEWVPMTIVSSAEFNQKLNARFIEFYESIASSLFVSAYKTACDSLRTQLLAQYKNKLADTLTSPKLSESRLGELLTFLCDSIAITGYSIQTQNASLLNRYGNKSPLGTVQPLTFCDYAANTAIHLVNQIERTKSPDARLQMPWQAAITLAFRDTISNAFHETIRSTINSKLNPLFSSSYLPKGINASFPNPDFSFTASFDVGNLDHIDFEAVNYPSLVASMESQAASLCSSISSSLTSLFSEYLSAVQDSTSPDNSTYPDGSAVTWITAERDNMLAELDKTFRSYFGSVAEEVWTREKIIEALTNIDVHPVSPQNWEWTKSPEKAQRHLPFALCPTADPCETLVPGEQCQFIERTATYTLPSVDMYNQPVYVQELDANGIQQNTEERKYDTFSFTYAEIIPPLSYTINPEGTATNTFMKFTGEEVNVWTSNDTNIPASTEIVIKFNEIAATVDRDQATPMVGFGIAINLDTTSGGYAVADVRSNKYGVVNDLKNQDPRGVFYKTDNCGRLYPCAFRIETAPYGYGVRATRTLGSYYAETDTCAPEFINDSATITRVFLDNRTFLAVHPSTQWHHTLTMCSEPPIPTDGTPS